MSTLRRNVMLSSSSSSSSSLRPIMSVDERLMMHDDGEGFPANELIHPWLDVRTWGHKNVNGHYKRELDSKTMTIFRLSRKWFYSYNGKMCPVHYDSLQDVIVATYNQYKTIIHQ